MTFSCALAALWPIPKYLKAAFTRLFFLLILIAYVLVNSGSRSFAQSRQDSEAGAEVSLVQPIQLGEKLPDSFWKQQHQMYQGGELITTTLESYRGKLLILDFWATWCGSCLYDLPRKVDSLRKVFASQMEVLPVSYETVSKLEGFNIRNDLFTRINLPTIISDSTLKALFPHKYIPFYAWIDERGYLRGLTYSEEFTAENLQKVLSDNSALVGGSVMMDYTSPVFTGKDHSYGSFYSDSLQGDIAFLNKRRYSEDNKLYSWLFLNTSLNTVVGNLAREAFKAQGKSFRSSQVVWEVDETQRSQTLTYEITQPLDSDNPLVNQMLHDLNSYSPYNLSIQPRELDCLVLRKLASGELPKSTSTEISTELLKSGYGKLTGKPLSLLLTALANHHDATRHVLDETGITTPVDLNLDLRVGFEQINEQLKSYGLQLIRQQRLVDVFVISAKADQVNPYSR